MKKRTLFRSGAAFLMGLLMTAAVGCFTSFAYGQCMAEGLFGRERKQHFRHRNSYDRRFKMRGNSG